MDIKLISKNIRFLRDTQGLSQIDLGKMIGASDKAVSAWERGAREPKMGYVQRMADIAQVTTDDFVSNDISLVEKKQILPDNILPIKRRMIPLLGNIAAGQPIWADESHEEYVLDNGDVPCDYALKVIGDSMEPLLYDGDIVFVKQQPDVQDGQIAVVLVEDSATLKVLYHIPEGIQLVSKNSAYAPMIYAGLRASAVRVLGLAVQYTRILI